MTGYGRAEAQSEAWQVAVEVNTVNHRYIDISVRLPRRYIALEHQIRKLVKERFGRGRFEIICSVSSLDGRSRRLVADEGLVAEAIGLMRRLQTEHGLGGSVDVTAILQFRELLRVEEAEEDMDVLLRDLMPVLTEALDGLESMRTEEGRALEEDIRARIGLIRGQVGKLAERLPEVQRAQRAAMEERLLNMLKEVPLDPQRLAQEVAYLAERGDVSEEITRLGSHLNQTENLLGAEEHVGRKLDFVIQEMNREVNTIGSKVSDLEVSSLVVEMKAEIEKIREQAQNVE